MKNTEVLFTKQDMAEWVEKQIALCEAMEEALASEQEDVNDEDVNLIVYL
jgi:hypothetical protein